MPQIVGLGRDWAHKAETCGIRLDALWLLRHCDVCGLKAQKLARGLDEAKQRCLFFCRGVGVSFAGVEFRRDPVARRAVDDLHDARGHKTISAHAAPP